MFLVTCIETLQQLSGKVGKKNDLTNEKWTKKELLFSFFNEYTTEEDKSYISERFMLDDDGQNETGAHSFQHFVGVINEYRNCAAHEGEYWDYCFNNSLDHDKYPLLLNISIDLENYSSKNKKKHCFQTLLSYQEFEIIFIQTCITFIREYNKKVTHCLDEQA